MTTATRPTATKRRRRRTNRRLELRPTAAATPRLYGDDVPDTGIGLDDPAAGELFFEWLMMMFATMRRSRS